ncbi:ABC transporter ATP-binding protein, partial [Mycobacterium tuberculosis]|nr:ABC transporter ATP-binding protein [Mycobacterium tuberculosis]
QGLSVGYDDRVVIEGLDVEIPDAAVTTIIGPNGCGKSTLLRAMSRLLSPREGVVLLDGADINHTKPKEVARKLGILPQNPVAPEGLT